MIYMKELVEGLEDLADAEFQRRAWLASEGPVVSSFTEDVCQVFDDTGLSDALNADICPVELDEQAFSVLKALRLAVSRVDDLSPPQQLLEDPLVQEVREIAARALSLIQKS